MKALSLSPLDAIKGMAGVQDGIYRVVNAYFIAHQNPAGDGGQEPMATKLQLVLHPMTPDGKLYGTDTETENYKVGDLKDFAPSIDGDTVSRVNLTGEDIGLNNELNSANLGAWGKYVIPVSTKPGITTQSKFSMLMQNLVNKTFDVKRMGNEPSFLIGLEAHFVKKSTKKESSKEEDKKFASQILEVEKIIRFPYEQGAVTAPAAASTAAAPAGGTSAPAASAPAPAAGVEKDKLVALMKHVQEEAKKAGMPDMGLDFLKSKSLVAATRNKAAFGHPQTQAAAIVDPAIVEEVAAAAGLAYDADSKKILW